MATAARDVMAAFLEERLPVGADGQIMVTSSVAAAANATIVGYVR